MKEPHKKIKDSKYKIKKNVILSKKVKKKEEDFLKTIRKINKNLDKVNKKNHKTKNLIKKNLKINNKNTKSDYCYLMDEKMKGFMNYHNIENTVKLLKKKIKNEPGASNRLMEVIKKYAFHNKMFFNDLKKNLN